MATCGFHRWSVLDHAIEQAELPGGSQWHAPQARTGVPGGAAVAHLLAQLCFVESHAHTDDALGLAVAGFDRHAVNDQLDRGVAVAAVGVAATLTPTRRRDGAPV